MISATAEVCRALHGTSGSKTTQKSVLGPDAAITWEAYLRIWSFRAPIAYALHNESSMVSESSALRAPALGRTSGQCVQKEGSHFDDGVRRREAIEGHDRQRKLQKLRLLSCLAPRIQRRTGVGCETLLQWEPTSARSSRLHILSLFWQRSGRELAIKYIHNRSEGHGSCPSDARAECSARSLSDA